MEAIPQTFPLLSETNTLINSLHVVPKSPSTGDSNTFKQVSELCFNKPKKSCPLKISKNVLTQETV